MPRCFKWLHESNINVSKYAHMCWYVRARVRVCARSHACMRVELHLHKWIFKQTCNKRAQTIFRLLVLEFCLLFWCENHYSMGMTETRDHHNYYHWNELAVCNLSVLIHTGQARIRGNARWENKGVCTCFVQMFVCACACQCVCVCASKFARARVFVCVCVLTCVCMCVCTRGSVHAHFYKYLSIFICVYVYIYVYTIYKRVYRYMYLCIYKHVYTYVSVYLHLYISTSINIYV